MKVHPNSGHCLPAKRLASLLRRDEMSPLFMDTGHELNSPDSMSAESNTAGSEREGEGQPTGKRGRKRQEKNRDAARKSRRKQTERADELHEELQSLERSGSALKKEIAALKKELHLYRTSLERHKPFCHLKDSSSSPSPPRVPHQASSSTYAAGPSLSTSLTDCVESTRLSSSTPSPPALATPSGSSTDLFTSSSSATAPVSFSAVRAPHSLFSEDPPPLITSWPTNVPPVCTSLASNPVPSSSLAAAALPQSGQGTVHESSSMSANACFPALHPGALDEFLMTQDSFLTSNIVPSYSHLVSETAGLVAPGCPMNVLHPAQFSRNSVDSSPPCSLLPPTLQDPALQSLSPASVFACHSHSPHSTLNPTPLLSLLTVPSPLDVSQTTSSSFAELQPPASLPLLGNTSGDISLSELLEVNDWILSGTSH